MIITCPNCNKKFEVNKDLIPKNGREIQCGSCNYNWYYKIKDPTNETLFVEKEVGNSDEILKNSPSDIFETKLYDDPIKSTSDKKISKKLENKKDIEAKKDIKISYSSKFFSYLIVFIISFVALILVLDTMKLPLTNIFPSLEVVMFNLYETLKDIRLFIIDLT
jgi:predicted Zn finger-like uncharacterized protein